jgi:hypothetical protein
MMQVVKVGAGLGRNVIEVVRCVGRDAYVRCAVSAEDRAILVAVLIDVMGC